MEQVILISSLVILIGLVPAWIIIAEKTSFMQKVFKYLLTISAGVLSAVLFYLIQHSKEYFDNILYIIGLAGIGYALFYLIDKYFQDSHHHHGFEKEKCNKPLKSHPKPSPKTILLGDFVHNTADGIAFYSAFLMNPTIGASVALGIALHEALMQTSVFIFLKEFGWSNKKALLWSVLAQVGFVFGVVIIAVLMLWFSQTNLHPFLIAFNVGVFTYILFNDIFPHILNTYLKDDSKVIFHIIALILGFALFMLIAHIAHE